MEKKTLGSMPAPILPSKCCGVESVLSIKGAHVRQSCFDCGKYVTFIARDDLPSVAQTKEQIWRITNDVEYIKLVKRDVGFVNGVEKELDPRLCYWHLYIQILRNFLHHKHDPITTSHNAAPVSA